MVSTGSAADPLNIVFTSSGSFSGNVISGNLGSGIVNFLLLAAVVFFVFVKPMNKLKAMTAKEAPPAPAEPSAEAKLLTEIRDMMKQQG